ncbi:MAG: hypothetical protein PWR20_2485 [Bacteroidales bacterium]|jgi:hypothetical protein|nr:hypothetical protein [Bacteroidales bacterium]MDN5330600.1 hypothetical protein [Bacteroidales bacterium]
MIRLSLTLWVGIIILTLVSCSKEKNTAIQAYDSIPSIVNNGDKFSYKFNIGYLSIDTLIALKFSHDTMHIHLSIHDYKSGYAGCYLIDNENNFLSISPLTRNLDTTLQRINHDSLKKCRIHTHKFTGNFLFEISH